MKTQRVPHAVRRGPIALAIATALGAGAGASTPAYAALEPGAAVGPSVTIFEAFETATEEVEFFDDDTDIALDADGDGVAVWVAYHGLVTGEGYEESIGIYFRRIHADGSVGEVVAVRETDDFDFELEDVQVAIDADGDAVVTWSERNWDTGTSSIWVRQIGRDDQPRGGAFPVSGFTEEVEDPRVGMDAAGNFVVAWHNDDEGNAYFHRFDALGNMSGSEEIANEMTFSESPGLAVSAKGDFVIGWAYGDQVFARRYAANGEPAEEQEFLAGEAAGEVRGVEIAVDADGDFTFAWNFFEETYVGPPVYWTYTGGVSARRFGADGIPLTPDAFGVELQAGEETGTELIGTAFDIDGDPVVSWVVENFATYEIALAAARVNADGTTESLDLEFDASCDPAVDTECPFPQALALDADGDMQMAFFVEDYSSGDPGALATQRFRGAEPADLAATLDVSASEVAPGDSVTLALTVENLHPLGTYYGVAAMDHAIGATTGVQLDVTLPAALAFPVSIDGWTCSSAEPESVSCVYANPLHAAEKIVFETTFDVPADASGEHAFGVTVSADRADPDAGNNAATASVTVGAPADNGGNTPPPAGGGGGGGAFGWLALFLLAPLARIGRHR